MSHPAFSWPHGARAAVSLTFDDARPSQVDRGVPILQPHGATATFYVSPPRLTERLEEWQAAVLAGHEIGNHTLTHPCSVNFPWSRHNALEDYTLDRMAGELDGANAAIQEHLAITPQTFAYPCGQAYVGREGQTCSYVPLVAERFIAGRGFRQESPNDPLRCDLAQLGAVEMDRQTFPELLRWLDQARSSAGWLILAGHDIGDGGQQTVLVATLEALLGHAAAPNSGLWLAPVAQVAEHVRSVRRALGAR